MFEYGTKNPSVPVIVGKLRVFQLRIQLRYALDKFTITPQTPCRCCFRVHLGRAHKFIFCRIALFFGIHELAIRFLIPPGVTQIGINEEVALVHVAIHALA